MKYSSKKFRECGEWIAEHGLMDYGGAKLQDYCKAMGIHDGTHRKWLRYNEYAEALERGKEAFRLTHAQKIFGTLMEAALGCEKEIEEENIEYRPDAKRKPHIYRMRKHKRKIYQKPDVTAGIFLLCNLAPEHFRQRQDNNISFRTPDISEGMSLDEIREELKRLEEDNHFN